MTPAAPPPAHGLPPGGRTLAGRYRLESVIGKGSMGTVWAAEHIVSHERFALKLIRHNQAQRPSMRKRMLAGLDSLGIELDDERNNAARAREGKSHARWLATLNAPSPRREQRSPRWWR